MIAQDHIPQGCCPDGSQHKWYQDDEFSECQDCGRKTKWWCSVNECCGPLPVGAAADLGRQGSLVDTLEPTARGRG